MDTRLCLYEERTKKQDIQLLLSCTFFYPPVLPTITIIIIIIISKLSKTKKQKSPVANLKHINTKPCKVKEKCKSTPNCNVNKGNKNQQKVVKLVIENILLVRNVLKNRF